ncbi:hypothetical protein Mapa_002123 [Marchantia paleacea]|nr:hypothetical protein Mapa_002123 [Marchantia paleacea]
MNINSGTYRALSLLKRALMRKHINRRYSLILRLTWSRSRIVVSNSIMLSRIRTISLEMRASTTKA